MDDFFDETSRDTLNGEPEPETAGREPEAAPEASEHTAEAEAAGEPEVRSAWSDAGYVPAEDAGAVPKTYHCAPAPERKERRRHRVPAAVLAVCLVGALAAGGIGGAYLAGRGADTEPAAETAAAAVINRSAPITTPGTAGTAADRGSLGAAQSAIARSSQTAGALTPTDIYYDLAVNQVVGITTEITRTNRWGYTATGSVTGSGFIISEDGYILTNYHVIEDAVSGGYDIQVLLHDGSKYVASVVGYAEDNDVAVLKLEAEGLSPVTFGDSDEILVGESVYAVGNPLGELDYTMTSGIVSAKDREISSTESGYSTTISMFQIDAAINSGNSGGPIYNARGEVIGIATAKYADTGVEGLGFAIPINDAVRIANDLITDGYVRGKAFMGILKPSTLSASSAQYYGIVPGVYFEGVQAGSAAEKAGLEVGDIIVGLDDQEIATYQELVSALKDYHAGDAATVKVYRDGEYLDLAITFDEVTPEVTASAGAQTEERDRDDYPVWEGRDEAPRGDGATGGYDDYDTYGDLYDYFDYFSQFFGGYPFGRS